MILADTSIWIEHFRSGLPEFASLLSEGSILAHPVIIGELATGNLRNRAQVLAQLDVLPRATCGSNEECMLFLEQRRLYGRGIGWNDIQILVASRLSGSALWSVDRRLMEAASELGIAYTA